MKQRIPTYQLIPKNHIFVGVSRSRCDGMPHEEGTIQNSGFVIGSLVIINTHQSNYDTKEINQSCKK